MTQKRSTSYCDFDPFTSFKRYWDLASRLRCAINGVIGAFCIYESLGASTGSSSLCTCSIITVIYLCPALANTFATSSSFHCCLSRRICLSLSLSDFRCCLCLTRSFHF